jgi:hypothetical protein
VAASVAAKTGSSRTALAIYIEHDPNWIVALPILTFLSEVSLHDVRLEPDTLYWRAQQTNLEYLLLLDVDRLVWNFRTQAGLTAPGTPYGGWEGPDVQLRGHFVGVLRYLGSI